jgi:hypothetical protein
MVGEERWTSWQIGGDGYMCTNEAIIHFGLGAAQHIAGVEIQWPSGLSQQLSKLQPNRRYLIVEGSDSAYVR